MKKRVLSLLLCFVLAAGLLSVCAPPAQAGTIAGAFEDFIKQPDQIKKLFGNEVAHGDCGPAGNEASVHYKIYEELLYRSRQCHHPGLLLFYHHPQAWPGRGVGRNSIYIAETYKSIVC